MFPVRCYTCNSVIGQHGQEYNRMLRDGTHAKAALSSLGIERICCRRMFIGHVDTLADQMEFGNKDIPVATDVTIRRFCAMETTSSCD